MLGVAGAVAVLAAVLFEEQLQFAGERLLYSYIKHHDLVHPRATTRLYLDPNCP